VSAVLKLRINNAEHSVEVDPDATLLTVLRDRLDLTGTKYGCGEGQCGACTVLIDGKARRSCLTRVSSVGDAHVLTIEGLEKNGRLHPLQQAFLDEGAFQCAYCTSGMILAGVAFLKDHPSPTETEIARGMNGNVCRCGTHPRIVAAVRKAAQALRGTGGTESQIVPSPPALLPRERGEPSEASEPSPLGEGGAKRQVRGDHSILDYARLSKESPA
jgi:aerobic-type carbon monoxide dehydrogenase small subunit (CoxS/CutS family)